jgi:sporulation protein YlmC with PRC-barrel domain
MNHVASPCHRVLPRPGAPRTAALAALLTAALCGGPAFAAGNEAAPDAAGTSAGNSAMTQSAAQPNFQQVMKVSDLLHKDIKNSNGDDIASVEDIAIDLPAARVDYVILSTGGMLGAGNRMVAVPPQALRQGTTARSAGQQGNAGQNAPSMPGSANNNANQQLTLAIADSDLKNMKAVDLKNWTALSDPAFFRETYRAAGVQVPENAAPSGPLAQASKLIGADAEDNQGKDVGEIHDVAIDLQDGRAPFAVVAYGGILGMGTKQTAIPTPSLKARGEEGGEEVTVAASESQIKSGKRLNEKQWRSLNGQWIANIYALYGVTPYWQTASNAAPGGAAGSFASLDTNGDGYITQSEAQQDQSLSQSFNRVDTNHDGKLDEGEFASFEAQSPGQSAPPANPSGPSGGASQPPPPSGESQQGQPGGSTM